MGFAHRSRSPAQTTNERTYDVLPNPDIFQSYRHCSSRSRVSRERASSSMRDKSRLQKLIVPIAGLDTPAPP